MIRPARRADAEQIAAVHVAGWRGAYTHIFTPEILANLQEAKLAAIWLERVERAPSSILVLEIDEHVRGFIQLGPTRDADQDRNRVGEVYALYLDPAHWRQGYGGALWNAGHQWLIYREFVDVSLWVLEDNQRGRAFYEKIGFQGDPGSRRLMERAGQLVPELRYRRMVADPS